jgi:hypothetical protein
MQALEIGDREYERIASSFQVPAKSALHYGMRRPSWTFAPKCVERLGATIGCQATDDVNRLVAAYAVHRRLSVKNAASVSGCSL